MDLGLWIFIGAWALLFVLCAIQSHLLSRSIQLRRDRAWRRTLIQIEDTKETQALHVVCVSAIEWRRGHTTVRHYLPHGYGIGAGMFPVYLVAEKLEGSEA